MKQINNFDELKEIETKHYKSAETLDLLFIRAFTHLIDGYALIIGADCKENLQIYFINNNFYLEIKNYINHYYTKF